MNQTAANRVSDVISRLDRPTQDNCDGSGPHISGEVRLLPIGGDGNLILCVRCFNREMLYRSERNTELGDFAKYIPVRWEDLKVYTNT